jgi:hypothetical protein
LGEGMTRGAVGRRNLQRETSACHSEERSDEESAPSSNPLSAEIGPFRVAPPSLDLLLSRDRRPDIRSRFEVHEAVNPVFRGEPRDQGVPVLVHPALKVVRNAGVEGFRAVRRDVNPILLLTPHWYPSIRPRTVILRSAAPPVILRSAATKNLLLPVWQRTRADPSLRSEFALSRKVRLEATEQVFRFAQSLP